jgi:hypothetical protein
VLEGEHTLDDTGDTGSTLGVSDIGLDTRYDDALVAEASGDSLRLDWIADRCTRLSSW